jgi:hypothetical protein
MMVRQEENRPLVNDQAAVADLDRLKCELLEWERAVLEKAHKRVFERGLVLAPRTRGQVAEILGRRGG